MANGSDRSWDTPPNVQGNSACIADWDPACGLHQGQQSFQRLHKQAEDKTASDHRQTIISSLAMREPSRQDISRVSALDQKKALGNHSFVTPWFMVGIYSGGTLSSCLT